MTLSNIYPLDSDYFNEKRYQSFEIAGPGEWSRLHDQDWMERISNYYYSNLLFT